MSLQEKKALVNILSSILVMGGYIYYTFGIHGIENMAHIEELKFWARFVLVLIPVSIVSKIAIYILFTIIHAVITRKKDPELVDEFDKLVELKSMRNGSFIFIIGFFLSMVAVVYDKPVSFMFIVLLSFGFAGDLFGELCKIYFYRRGIR